MCSIGLSHDNFAWKKCANAISLEAYEDEFINRDVIHSSMECIRIPST